MKDGWYRLVKPSGTETVEHVYRNTCESGTVGYLQGRGYLFEEVLILTPAEFDNRVMIKLEELLRSASLAS